VSYLESARPCILFADYVSVVGPELLECVPNARWNGALRRNQAQLVKLDLHDSFRKRSLKPPQYKLTVREASTYFDNSLANGVCDEELFIGAQGATRWTESEKQIFINWFYRYESCFDELRKIVYM